ncbi:geranylgeranyl pyrophosphate synthetase [Phlyctema vagabunda]|uniref:Geranylgeranyl pyrophosphate synthetase n=1 Tax=Phlyctema vagabunda TaxID=108571 RepID=A0ABR4P540_9HELO
MASATIFEISRSDLQGLKTPTTASITDVKALSSYNWIEASKATPTIAVPGMPALWSAPDKSSRLKKDSGLIYIAQNAARHPESPLEPLFRAVYLSEPSFDIRSMDVVTDRNNMRKLLCFVDPSTSRNAREPFTIEIEVVRRNTAIFCRHEAKTCEYIGPREFRGFGHAFEKAYTADQLSGSTGHHRIISYHFGDLSFLVRHETDGYVDPAHDGLSSMLGALSLAPADRHPKVVPTASKLVVRSEGQVVPLESTLEIKTRVSHKPMGIQEVAPQLWLSQTPKLVRAYHQNGTFQKPVVEDVTTAIKSWEEGKQDVLKRLAALVRRIIYLAKECGGTAVLKYDVKGDKLVLSRVDRKDMLPKDLYEKWDDVPNSDEEAST